MTQIDLSAIAHEIETELMIAETLHERSTDIEMLEARADQWCARAIVILPAALRLAKGLIAQLPTGHTRECRVDESFADEGTHVCECHVALLATFHAEIGGTK